MALQGNPFLGKLKIPAPDLSHIPETPFEVKISKPSERCQPASLIESPPESIRLQTASIGVGKRLQTASALGFNGIQTASSSHSNRLQDEPKTPNGSLLNPNEAYFKRLQTASALGFKLPPIGELVVLRYLADHESTIGAPVIVRRRELAAATAQTLAGVKTALLRLSKTLLIELVEFKRGKTNGYTSYRLTAESRTILASKEAGQAIGFNRLQTASIGFPSSSSIVLEKDLKTTTTGEQEILENGPIQLSPVWVNLDLTPLTGIGFTQNHLTQIIRQGKLTPEEVQDSIHFFAFDLEKNQKAKELKKPPLNFFMGILRKSEPYAPPANFESAADEARRKTREFKARKERERQAEDQQLLDLDFSEWRRGLPADELAALLPDYAPKGGQVQESALKKHFETNVWPKRSQEFSGITTIDRADVARQIEQSLTGVSG